MRTIRLLDCTLRDGGFVNDWNFGRGSIKSIIGRLDSAGIDVIEVGFLDDRRKTDPDRSIQPDSKSLKAMLKNAGVKKSMLVVMIDYGTCAIGNVGPRHESGIDGIRVIFKKKDIDGAMAYCAALKEKGYKVFVNPVSVTGYSDVEMDALLDKVNNLSPFGISIVDTYGLMHKKELVHYYNLMDRKLAGSICIGYHSHNNFQLSYAGCIELLGVESGRDLVLDGSLYGMGKSAGNANTELIAMHLNKYFGSHYDVNQILEAIDVDIMKEYAKKYWGYSLMHFIAASNDCHPDFVKKLIEKRTLSVKSVGEILQKLDPKTRLTFSKDLIEKLYEEYQNVYVDDKAAFSKLAGDIGNRSLLLLGPGGSIEKSREAVENHIKKEKPAVISINFMTDKYASDYVFIGNAKRYSQFYDEIYGSDRKPKVICTSNVTGAGKAIDYVFNFNSLIDAEGIIRDNPLLMLIKILVKIGVKSAVLAGFDGYSADTAKNYYNEYIKYLYCDDDVLLRNELIKTRLNEFKKSIKLEFLTPTVYE